MIKKSFYIIVILGLMCSSVLLAQQQGTVQITATDTLYHDIQSNASEIEILKELFESTNGKRWKNNENWLKNDDFSRWFGIVTEYGDVVEIHLDNNNLRGAIPKSVYKLIRLRHVSFSGNHLSEARATNTFSKSAATETTGFSQLSGASENSYGKNLPVWGLAVKGSIQKLDWRNQPPAAENLVAQPTQVPAASGVGIDDCGRLAFYVLHTGVDSFNQLNIYAADGTQLTTSTTALSSVVGNNEIQVVRVPGKSDEWYIIYSLWYTNNCGVSPQASIYCPAQVVYTRIKYDATTKVLTFIPNQREVRIGSTLTDTYIQGKAVSRTVDNDPSRHYLYLAARTNASAVTRIHRFIIDSNGVTFQSANNQNISVGWWAGTIAGSTIELSPDENTLAINNRNAQQNVVEDIILFDVTNFNSPTYQPITISVPNLRLQDIPDKTLREVYTTMPQYACLKNLKYKLNGIQFSPSGQYLYVTHGGYPLNTGGLAYNTYLLQIDLASATNPEQNNFIFRTQIQLGLNFSSSCTGSSINANDHAMGQIESAFDGRIYFTKASSNTLFVIPNPDDPMPHSLAAGTIDLSGANAPNINVLGGTGAYVTFMPENIDGFDYLKESSVVNFNLVPESISTGGSTTLTILGFASANKYQISWGDGAVETVTTATRSHVYSLAGEYNVKLTLTTPSGCTTITSKTVNVGTCTIPTTITISNVNFICAIKFSTEKLTDCLVTYNWNFGDGTTSPERNPIHVYGSSGTYNVTLTANYNCESCQGTKTVSKSITYSNPAPVLEPKTIQIVTDQKLEVLSSTASSFSDTWSLNQPNNALDLRGGYVNGTQGVWRNLGTYVYKKDRSMTPGANISKDGTFTLEQFNWKYAELNGVPNWIKSNTITRYSPYSFELENQDVLGVYSAAIYDYNGQLPAANGVNMRQDEMAFTSFESIDGTVAGNWILAALATPEYTQYSILSAGKNLAVVNATLVQLQNVTTVDVIAAPSSGELENPNLFFQANEIICMRVHPDNPLWSVIVLKSAPIEDYWVGNLRIKNIVSPTVNSVFDAALAHTGKKSLKISSNQTFKQDLLNLDAGKSYWINSWVSVNNPYVTTPTLASGLGVDIIARQKNGQIISTFSFAPAGIVIEGWQQLKGSFVCPANTAYVEILFKPGGTGTAWYDDLRLHPENGNMKGYVYNLSDFRLQAVLDEENFASYFYYDREGNLHLTKKETTDGIKTLSENISYQVER